MTNFRPYIPPASLTARMVANTAVVTGWEIRLPSGVLLPEMDPKRMESAVTPTSVAPPLSATAGPGVPMGVPAAAFAPPAAGVFAPRAAAPPAAFWEAPRAPPPAPAALPPAGLA